MSGKQTLFVQFVYCPLCQISYKKGKKHVHSKKHQEIVNNIFKKFLKKIQEARSCLASPKVHDTTWPEQHANFWCYFCQADVARHLHSTSIHGDCVAVNGGMLQHMTRADHNEKTATFLRRNKLDVKRTQEFTLSSKDFLKYLEETEKASASFSRQKAQKLGEEASMIRHQEAVRKQMVASAVSETVAGPPSCGADVRGMTPTISSARGAFLMGQEQEWKKTARAFGEGLTVIDRSQEDDSVGNMYTNAVPPWMIADAATDKTRPEEKRVFKPDLVDLEKHKKLVKKSKLNAHRVGASYERGVQTSEGWLPNFGGVWNHGRRTKASDQFQRRRFGKASTATSTATSSAVSCGVDPSPSTQHHPPNHLSSAVPSQGGIIHHDHQEEVPYTRPTYSLTTQTRPPHCNPGEPYTTPNTPDIYGVRQGLPNCSAISGTGIDLMKDPLNEYSASSSFKITHNSHFPSDNSDTKTNTNSHYSHHPHESSCDLTINLTDYSNAQNNKFSSYSHSSPSISLKPYVRKRKVPDSDDPVDLSTRHSQMLHPSHPLYVPLNRSIINPSLRLLTTPVLEQKRPPAKRKD